MIKVVGIRFQRAGKIYYFDPLDYDLETAMHVIVETARGVEMGTVLIPPKEVDDDKVVQPLKPVIRIATEDDEKVIEKNKEKGEVMNKILERFKNFFSASHDREQKGIQSTKHGMLNNFMYAVKLTWSFSRIFIIAVIAGGILISLYNLIGIYIPKIALALVEQKVSTDVMIKVMVIVGVATLILNLIAYKASYICEYQWENVYKGIVSKYLRKSFTTDFKNMENPDFLDLTQRSKQALYTYQGIHGYCMRGQNIIANLTMVFISGFAIALVNPVLVLVIITLSFFIYKILDSTMEWSKTEFRDAMASNYRKNSYFSNTARDFKYAKDIRLFKMQFHHCSMPLSKYGTKVHHNMRLYLSILS